MRLNIKLLTGACVALALSSLHSHAQAAANGDGLCSAAEAASFECAKLGGNIVEFLGSFPSSQCRVAATNQTVACTSYYYRYTGAAINQLNVAIPTRNTKVLTAAADLHCAQFLTGGSGDPTTGFGKNQLSIGICRVASNSANLAGPPDVTAPPGANFVISVDPSVYDSKNPLDWQLKQGASTSHSYDDDHHGTPSSVFAASLVGPFGPQAEVLESLVTLTTPAGESVSYSNIAGNIKLVGTNIPAGARVIPAGGTKLCTVNVGGNPNLRYDSPDFASNWTCETVTFASDQCDIKTGADPCRMIGGTCIKY